MIHALRDLLALGLVLATMGQLPASPMQELARGRVIESVACKSNPSQSYALYLPSGYSPDRTWPILYAFDAGARGALPVERFKEAAERYGYIVAGSNNSRNGPMTIADEAMRAIVADTEARFPLDAKRVYVTGLSGGARVAVVVGLVLNAAGVIGCAAGFHQSVQPSASLPFAYFGTTGTDDFNYPELAQLDDTLERLKVPHRLAVFEGGHGWPPVRVCTRAIEWMELQAMRTSIRPTDAALIDDILQRWVGEAGAAEREGRLHAAFEDYSAIARDFALWRDVGVFEEKRHQLSESRQVRTDVNERRRSIELQASADAQISRLLTEAIAGQDRALALQEASAAIDQWRRQSNEARNSAGRMASRRVLALAWSRLNADVADALDRGNTTRPVQCLQLMARIRPDNPRVDYLLARIYARTGKKKAALEALQRAVGKGFDDAAAVESEADFAGVATEKVFRDVLARLRGVSRPTGR